MLIKAIRNSHQPDIEKKDAQTSIYYDDNNINDKQAEIKKLEKQEATVAISRQQILQRYNIPAEHIISLPFNKLKRARDICVFYIIKNKSQADKIYYADGFAPHNYLLEKIIERFGKDMGIASEADINNDNFFRSWIIYKGFIDPYRRNFQTYKHLEKILYADLLRQAKENNLDTETINKLKNKQPIKLPNWFTAYVSIKQ